MQVGTLPRVGALLDESLKGMSAESIYDLIVRDLRRYRKLQTLRGFGASDVLEGPTPGWWLRGDGVTLDEFYRNAIAMGLCRQQAEGRGFVPAGLVEEIRSLSQPPIPWDVQLAHWFDEYFPSIEKRRSYARLSRRQSSSPNIPIPRYVPPDQKEARTFGVVLDTSGSMHRTLLAHALGAIASYAMSRDVTFVRLISCDAAAFDHGYLPPEEIADRIELKGRGGTILQPGIDHLERAEDFPKTSPILLITDGWCDSFQTTRDHAILLPAGRSLPFIPRAPVFRFSEK
jgi:predicted metal-dependent peptidase